MIIFSWLSLTFKNYFKTIMQVICKKSSKVSRLWLIIVIFPVSYKLDLKMLSIQVLKKSELTMFCLVCENVYPSDTSLIEFLTSIFLFGLDRFLYPLPSMLFERMSLRQKVRRDVGRLSAMQMQSEKLVFRWFCLLARIKVGQQS